MRLLPQVDHFLASLNIMEDMTMKLEDIIALAKAGYKPSDIKELVKLAEEAQEPKEPKKPDERDKQIEE